MKRFSSLAFFLALNLSACGKFLDKFSRIPEDGFTSVTISGSRSGQFLNPNTPLSGGVIVYATGKLSSGAPITRTFNFPNEGSDSGFNFTVPNGQYKFVVVGWPQNNLIGAPNSVGALRCGVGADSSKTDGFFSLQGNAMNIGVEIGRAHV